MIKKIHLSILLVFIFSQLGIAQITGPASANIGVPVNYSTTAPGANCTWLFDPINFSSTFVPVIGADVVGATTTGTGVNGGGTIITYNGNWYGYLVTTANGIVSRIDMGTDPANGTKTITAINAALSPADNSYQGCYIVKDESAGTWHGFIVGKNKIFRLDFGTDPTSTPTVSAAMSFPSDVQDPRDIRVVNDGSEWFIFVGINGSYRMTALRFGTGNPLTATPTSMTNLSSLPVDATNLRMAFYKEGSDWYLLTATSIATSKLIRYKFGSSLANIPTRTDLTVANTLSYAGNITIVPDVCNNKVVAYIYCGGTGSVRGVVKYDFQNSIANTPTATALNASIATTYTNTNQNAVAYVYNDTLSLMLNYWGGGAIRRLKLLPLPTGSSSPEKTVTHAFSSTGTFSVGAITDIGRTPAGFCNSVTVTSAGPAQPGPLTVAKPKVCANEKGVTYTVPPVSGAVSYQWKYTPGTGVTINGSGTIVTLDFASGASNGTLSVSAVDGSGNISISRDSAITVNAIPVISAISGGPAICAKATVTLTTSPAGGTWSSSNTAYATITNAGVLTAVAAGSPVIKYVYTNANNCTDSVNTTVMVNPLPVVAITASRSTSICNGDTLILSTAGNTGVSYSWTQDNTAISTNNDSLWVTGAGKYNVTVTNTTTTCKDTAAIYTTVTVNALPVTSVNNPSPVALCQGDNVALTATGSGVNDTYKWKNGATVVGTSATQTVSATGSYQLVVANTVTGCRDSAAPIAVTIYSIPTILLAAVDTEFCDGDAVTMQVITQDTGLIYRWKKDNADIQGATADFLEVRTKGAYQLVATQSSVMGCSDSTVAVTINVHPLPMPAIIWNDPTFNTDPGYDAYQWYKDGVAITGATAVTYKAREIGTYTVVVTDSNTCSNSSSTYYVSHINPLGIENYDMDANAVKVYPNPATDVLSITATDAVDIVLLSVDGKVLITQHDAKKLDISALPKGVYLLRIEANGVLVKTEKVIKVQ